MGRIDLHHHVVPRVYREALSRAGADAVGGIPLPPWSEEEMIERMDALDIERAIVSVSAPGTLPLPNAEAAPVARAVNDELAALRDAHATRLGVFATLPLPDVPASLTELERALGVLRVDGVSLLTSYDGTYLGDPAFEPLLAALDDRRALVHLHPNLPVPGPAGLVLPAPVLEFVFDTTRAVADLIVRGTLRRFPSIRWVLAHLGGALPFLAPRLSMLDSALAREHLGGPRDDVVEHLREVAYDIALSGSPANLALALATVGPERLVYGSDVPFAPPGAGAIAAGGLASVDPEVRAAIERGNAERLLA